MANNEKERAFETAVKAIEKKHGAGTIIKMGDTDFSKGIEVISSGCFSLDLAMGVGGYPKGRIIEIFGVESGGKTTMSLHAIAQAQQDGGIAAFIDAEHSFDPTYAENLGVDVSNLRVSQPESGEQALDIVEMLARSGATDLIVVDSVAALIPRAELDGEMGDSHMGLHARLMSQAMRKLTAIVGDTNTCLIFINQIRMKIQTGFSFGNPETTTGGRALKFYSSMRLDVRRIGPVKDSNGEIIGNKTKIKVVKNKVAIPFKECICELIYGEGISQEADLLDTSLLYDVIEQAGAYYKYEGENIGQGREQVKQKLKDDDSLYEVIQSKLLRVLGGEAEED